MAGRPQRLKLDWRDADAFIAAVHSQDRVTGLTHDFYKYPARFSPQFASAAIEALTDPGDTVVDPFVGGGTTLVESRANGRLGVGTDISTLATFVSRAKTRVLQNSDIEYLEKWFDKLTGRINLHRPSKGGELAELGYTRNLDARETWAIRKAIEQSLVAIRRIRDQKRQDVARCILLRTSQWALDGRKQIPSVGEFRVQITKNASALLAGAREFAAAARKADRLVSSGRHRTICKNSRAEALAQYFIRSGRDAPRLVLTSPPYPGVHILYHRWQVSGGKETPAPFWIANKMDGAGEAYYLMHARRPDLEKYSKGIEAAFSAMSKLATSKTVMVQMVAFSDPASQLPGYLDIMQKCGLQEVVLSEHVDSPDGRLWRKIPGRKWHAATKGELESSKEVVLIHRIR